MRVVTRVKPKNMTLKSQHHNVVGNDKRDGHESRKNVENVDTI